VKKYFLCFPVIVRKILISIFLVVIFAFSNTAVPIQSNREFQIKIHDANQVEICVSNYGKYGQDETGWYGCWWPKGSGHEYIFGAGPWFGTIDAGTGDTLVTIGYGPHGGESEYTPGLAGMSFSDKDAIIFMYPVDWPPPAATYPMAPQNPKSHQDSWCAYNDLDPTYHIPGDTRPIGLEVYQTVYAWNLSTTQDIIFIRYELKNVSGSTLTECYFGICADNAIGNEVGTAANDIISGIVGKWYVIDEESLWIDNLGYQWQEEEESGWDRFPGTIGFDYLQSPFDLVANEDKDNDGILDQYERDSAYYWNNLPDSMWDVDLDGTPDWRDASENPQIGMTAFKRFTLDLEPNVDNERYVTLAGFNFKTGAYEPFDTVPPQPDDQRFLQCSGPFELEPDSIAVVLVGVMFAEWHDTYVTPDTALVQVDNTTQFIYDKNWLLPGPPPPPTLTALPGDTRITLIWDSKSESTPDPYYDIVSQHGSLYDPYYLQYDFEGYGVWKSQTGNIGDWRLLDRYDLYNGIVFVDTTIAESLAIYANDRGLVHSYVDNDVRNGFTYYYAVTAFDYNYINDNGLRKPIWFESGAGGVPVAPRRDPANLVPGTCSLEVVSGNPLLAQALDIVISQPLEMTSEELLLEFRPIDWAWVILIDTLGNPVDTVIAPVYMSYFRRANNAKIDSISMLMPFAGTDVTHNFPEYNGLSVFATFTRADLPTDKSLFERIEIVTGTYDQDLLEPVSPGPFENYWNFWAYRGNDYEIYWFSTSGSDTANSVVVLDAMTGDTIPYSPYDPDPDHLYDSFANGWCFMSVNGVSDTIVSTESPPALWNTKWLYICGALMKLKGGGFFLPSDELPSTSDVWTAYASQLYDPAPVSALLRIHPTPAYFDSVTQQELNVKVVPNPYIVHNEWQESSRLRRLKFINLPNRCTIRIFNLNGELIKTIKHSETGTIDGQYVQNNQGGDEWWDLLSENRQLIVSGVYIFHIQSDIGEQVGKFAIIR
jgi:hypothetical protein